MSARSRFGAFVRQLTALVLAAGVSASAALAAVPESEPPVLLAQATESTEQPAQPVSSTPDSFTATYGDWQLRCQRNAADPASPINCDVAIFIVAQGQQQPFAQISVSKGVDGAMHLTAVVPVNVLVRTQPMVATDAADAGLEVPWLTCSPVGCLADVALGDADVERFRAYTGQGRLVFIDGVGNQVTVTFSFRGLSQALDALTAELAK